MPAFDYLPEPDRRAVVDYVKFLTAETTPDGRRLNRFEEAKKTGPAAQQKGEEFLFVFCLFSLQAQIFEWSEKKTEFNADGALLETDEVQV